MMEQECRCLSPKTLQLRKIILHNLVWWMRNRHKPYLDLLDQGRETVHCDQAVAVDVSAMRGFYIYLGRPDPNGKWDRSDAKYGGKRNDAASARTIKTYDNHLRTFFSWLVKQEHTKVNLLGKIDPPVCRKNQIEVFTDRDIHALIEAVKRGRTGRRDIAIILLLLETGIRASELCGSDKDLRRMPGLKVRDVDFDNRRIRVVGKGNKERTVNFGKHTARALYRYLQDGRRRGDGIPPDPDMPLFRGIKGRNPNSRFTTSGLGDMLRTAGRDAGIKGVRCSPHTLRHTFATRKAKQNINAFALMEMLGHTDLSMTKQYMHLAQVDIEQQFKSHSVVDEMVD